MAHHCKINVASGYATDSSAWPVAMRDACQTCQGCESNKGHGSMTAVDGIYLRQEFGRTLLVWACPICHREVIEKTELLRADEHAARIASDLLCHPCRKAATPSPEGAQAGGQEGGAA